MRIHLRDFVRFFAFESLGFPPVALGRAGLLAMISLFAAATLVPTLLAQTPNRITKVVDTTRILALPNHHPLWANDANDAGALPAEESLNQFTMVLARSAEQEQAFEQLLADQQNPASPNYHHWLTPAEIGDQFGLSSADIATMTSWLESQGLHVNWVSPSRIFIGFGGAAADVGRAFQTEMHAYKVNGEERISVASDPMIPEALAPAITSIRGLYTIPEKPSYRMEVRQEESPQVTTSNGNHYISPSDFATIYDLPTAYTGAGYTIGIVSWSRTNPADFTAFDSRTDASVVAPTEVIPTAYGGLDPGPAYTTTQTCTNNCIGGQTEATLDVLRASTVATGARILLVVSAPSGANDGIGADAQYLVQTSPVPAQVMNISFGGCESSAGAGGVAFWNALFQQGAAEGISTFVSSGDSGAAGCDVAFSAPPASPAAISPNYICTSSYATCVGGTEFNDTSSPATYWSGTNSSTLGSALSYIPEGGWNESTTSSVAASGGGVSLVNTPTPSWQTGTGVPAARAGRYTPDVSFSASGHDGYFGCMAAAGGSCVGNPYYFVGFYGTSAAAPAMAGVAAMLDQKYGAPLGSLNPELYSMAASAPAAFHDATVATSGVSSCSLSTASMCNNSIPLVSGSGTQAGYQLQTGYDEVTGLGSLDVNVFLNNYTQPTSTPTVAVNLSSSSITTAEPLTVTVTVSSTTNTAVVPMGTVTIASGAYSSIALTLSNGSVSVTIPAGSLAVGTDTLTASYTPQASTNNFYNAATGSATVTVTAVPKITPAVGLTLSASNITTAQPLSVTVAVNGGTGNQVPTGTVTLTSTGYSSGPMALTNGGASISVLADTLPAGVDGLTVSYTPDSVSSSIYNSASGSSSVTVTAVPKITPTIGVNPSPTAVTTTQNLYVSIVVGGGAGTGNQTPTGTVKLTSGSYSQTGMLSNGNLVLAVPPGSLPPGNDTLTAAYTPDATSSSIYNTVSGTSTVTVTIVTPVVSVVPSPTGINYAQPLSVTVVVIGTGNNPTPTGSTTLTSSSYSSGPNVLTAGSTVIAVPAGVLAPGADTLTASYTPDSTSSTLYTGATGSSTITVTKATPSITWNTPAAVVAGTALSATQLNATASVPGTFVYTPPLGTVMSSIGTTTLSTTFAPTNTADYNTATASVTLTVASITPAYTVSGTAVTVTAGATAGNVSTVTVTPSNNFIGNAVVTLTAAITASPSGAINPPTLSFGSTNPVTITSVASGTGAMTITTTASSTTSCVASNEPGRGIPWYAGGGAALACMLLFGIAPQRRKLRAPLGALMLLAVLAGGVSACGGSKTTACSTTIVPGTTAGSYTITVTGTSGSTVQTGTVSLTVQ